MCQSLGLFKSEDIQCIASSDERYVSVKLGNLRFVDSYQFLNCSLDELVESFHKDKPHENFKHFSRQIPDDVHANLLMRKGIYPYEYVDCPEKFNEKRLPDIDKFYSHLRWYQTLQGDNSLKSVERFDHMMFVCRFQASR